MGTENKCTEHSWAIWNRSDLGEMDYSSYGGGVEHFIVTTYYCKNCGAVETTCEGPIAGDPSEYLIVYDYELEAIAKHVAREKAKEKKRAERKRNSLFAKLFSKRQ